MHKRLKISKKVSDSKKKNWPLSQEWFFISLSIIAYFSYTFGMYIAVIPLARSLHPRPYTYFVTATWSEQIIIGGMVEISIWSAVEKWIIASIEEIPPRDVPLDSIKPIISVISSIPLLSPYILAAILSIAGRYSLPIHKALALFFPVPLQSRLDKKNYLLENILWENNHSENPKYQILNYLDTVFSPSNIGDFLIEDTVLIFPDDMFLSSFEDAIDTNLEKLGQENTALTYAKFYAESTPTRRSQGWIDIYEKKYKIIVWTRRLLYYNLEKYKNIVYIEDAFGMEYYQYPTRIKNLDILKYIADSKQFNITILSSSPTLSLFANFRDFKIVPMRNTTI